MPNWPRDSFAAGGDVVFTLSEKAQGTSERGETLSDVTEISVKKLSLLAACENLPSWWVKTASKRG